MTGLRLATLAGALIALALVIVALLLTLQRQAMWQPVQPVVTSAPLVSGGVLKVHLHELYNMYKKSPEAANERWRDRLIVTVGYVKGFTKEGDLIIRAEVPVDVILPCPVKGSEREMLEKGARELKPVFVAVSGRIASMEERIAYGFPPIGPGYNYFWLSLQDCKLINVSEVREFEAHFFRENLTVVVHNYAYDIVVLFRKADEPTSYITSSNIVAMLNPFERETRASIEPNIREVARTPGDYVLEVIDAKSQVVLASWKIKIPG
jgi:hypothetical protein